jgi:hypothetical protein
MIKAHCKKWFNHVLFQVFMAAAKMLGIFGDFTVYWDLFVLKSEEHSGSISRVNPGDGMEENVSEG